MGITLMINFIVKLFSIYYIDPSKMQLKNNINNP